MDIYNIQIEVPWGYVAGRWYGNRNVRPILAIHGWQDNLGTWDRLIPLLPQHIGVLCIDLPGHGRSSKYPKGATYHTIDHVHIIKRVIDEFNWDKVSLLGHSLGGLLCYIYAALYPDTVDMLIQVDIIISPDKSSNLLLNTIAMRAEKFLLESEHTDLLRPLEPPSYTYEQLEEVLHKASQKSLAKDNCKHILNRNIQQSKRYPQKYFFSRDGKLKYNVDFIDDHGLFLEMAKNVKKLNHLVIRANRSNFITDKHNNIIEFLQTNNPNFQIHAIDGTHYVHLNNPYEVADVLKPFIVKHRRAPCALRRRMKCKL